MKQSIVEAVESIEPNGRLTRIVVIDGFGGCGKSELAERLARRLGRATVVHTDDFARPNVPGWEWARLRAQVLEPVLNDRPGRYQGVSASLIAAGLVATGGTFASGEKVRAACLGVPATMVGTAGADVLRGTPKRDVIAALGGADRLYGRAGDDLL